MHSENDIEKFLAKFAVAAPDDALREKLLRNSRVAWDKHSTRTLAFSRILQIAATAIVAVNLVSALLLFYEGRQTDEFISKCRTSPERTDAMRGFVVELGLDAGYAESLVGSAQDADDESAAGTFEEQGAEVEKLLKGDGRS